jgi:hypothetical protein
LSQETVNVAGIRLLKLRRNGRALAFASIPAAGVAADDEAAFRPELAQVWSWLSCGAGSGVELDLEQDSAG